MSTNVTSLKDALGSIRDFRHPQGRRYKLQSVLVLSSLAMINGAQSEQAIAEWSDTQGRRWLGMLGIRRHRGPSQATIQRIFRGIDRAQLDEAMSHWSRQVLAAAGDGRERREDFSQSDLHADSLGTLSQWLDLVKPHLQDQHISEAGLKIWGLDIFEGIAQSAQA